jgi:ribosomal protein L11 methyltransferase
VPQLAVTLNLDGLDAERVEEACFEFGALAVSYTDMRDDPILEPAPGEFRLWPHSRLQALFSFDCKPEEIVAGLSHVLRIDSQRMSIETLADRVWEREWLRDLHPMCFGRRLWVAPHHSHVHTQGAVIVRLDPGLAFGTGTHATTAMCLAWLDENAHEGATVIDYGCGSGVLAVAAAKLGARAAHAFDIDPQALTATRDNAAANQVEHRVHVVPADAQLSGGADILLANILCGPLCELAPRFAALTAPGGKIVLAGLLAAQADEVTRAHAPWFDISPFATRDGWTALAGSRRSS